MEAITAGSGSSLKVFDADVAPGATLHGNVWGNAVTTACSIELRVALLGSVPVTLALRVLGQITAPASDTDRLLPLNVPVPSLTGLAADYSVAFVVPVLTPFNQIEIQNVSGGLVHVTGYAFGSKADPTADDSTAGIASHVVVDTLPTAAQSDLDTLAGAVAGGVFKVLLQAGANAIGKLAANAGVVIGDVNVASLPSLVLAAGTNAIGKLAANAGVVIGDVNVASLPSLVLAAGANAIGKLAANAGVVIGDVNVATLPALPTGSNSIGAVTVALPTSIYSGVTPVATAGNRVALASSQALKEGVDIMAHANNTGLIYVGGGTVAAANGRRLSGGQSVYVRIADLATVSIDSQVSGEGVSYLAS